MRRTAEPWRPGLPVARRCPRPAPAPAHHPRSRDLLGKHRAVPLYLFPGLFFCLTSVISNQHEMTIKGFFNESHFYWLGFLGLLVQLSRDRRFKPRSHRSQRM